MSEYKLFPCDMVVPCDTFQCFGRAAYFIGKEDAPKSTLTKICQHCADELAASVLDIFGNQVLKGVYDKAVKEIPSAVPFEAEPDQLFDKKIVDWTVLELREKCDELGLTGYRNKNKAELIHLIEGAFKHE